MTLSRPVGHPGAILVSLALGSLAFGTLLAGCGSSSSGTATTATSSTSGVTPTSPVTTSPSSTKVAGPVTPGQVDIVDFDFTPNTITVKAGDTVTWANQDTSDHWVVSAPSSPTTFDLGRESTDATVTFTFAAPGSYAYFCNLHNYMKGVVVVQ